MPDVDRRSRGDAGVAAGAADIGLSRADELDSIRHFLERGHLFIYVDNEIAKRFWQKNEFFRRGALIVLSKDIG